jgi:hypothetical protein
MTKPDSLSDLEKALTYIFERKWEATIPNTHR